MNRDDILMWPDNFWCFNEEFDAAFLRNDNYRVIGRRSKEWTALVKDQALRLGVHPKKKAAD